MYVCFLMRASCCTLSLLTVSSREACLRMFEKGVFIVICNLLSESDPSRENVMTNQHESIGWDRERYERAEDFPGGFQALDCRQNISLKTPRLIQVRSVTLDITP
eukprot:Blabericola_migrator_1__13161@NODE_900_length_6144_cov_117_164061_g630_i0_p6_GENE_NODE_900_length_6144_cov_117_164061_g630_i0NODE_900_length_6144_cov_117_164061_g630_i0_p6_ORF_typecomplete_len105_score6_84_NODE_900_length_6144_cov_117_164061_g630_i041524466